MADLPGRWRLGLTRILTAAFGICSIAWAASSIPVYRAEAALTAPAQRILAGDKFSPEQLDALTQQIDSTPAGSLRPSSLVNVATIRLRLAEIGLQSGNAQLSSQGFDKLETALGAALDGSPTNPFLWLTDYWLRSARAGNPGVGLKSLGMSYALGPNEGWIAVRRSPLALRAFPSLPDGLADQVVVEFAGMVRSGFYSEAADILVGAGWPVHEKLLAGLVQVDEGNRRRFAKVLEWKDLDGIAVPGVETRPSRPF